MSVYVDSNSKLHHDQERSLAILCPHCQVYTHITAVSVPQFAELVASRPNQVGVVYRCDSCSAPIFLKFAVKMYAANRVELANNFVELERAKEKFNFTYLPEQVEQLFREALGCYSAGYFNAFASMCRRTAQTVYDDLGENGRLRIFEQIREARELAEIDSDTFAVVKKVLFGGAGDPSPLPELNPSEAGVLLELIKDMLYEAYVRKGKLQQAMMVRRFFAEETLDKITPIGRLVK
jgi:DNA-directed RNA polymerase subunit RPC12/RpoP